MPGRSAGAGHPSQRECTRQRLCPRTPSRHNYVHKAWGRTDIILMVQPVRVGVIPPPPRLIYLLVRGAYPSSLCDSKNENIVFVSSLREHVITLGSIFSELLISNCLVFLHYPIHYTKLVNCDMNILSSPIAIP